MSSQHAHLSLCLGHLPKALPDTHVLVGARRAHTRAIWGSRHVESPACVAEHLTYLRNEKQHTSSTLFAATTYVQNEQ